MRGRPGRFHDRRDAGRALAAELARRSGLVEARPIIAGLPRGGVVVAAEVARELDAPIDIVLVRKLGAPQQPELAIGAVGEDDVVFVDDRAVHACGVDPLTLEALVARERAELARRGRRYRGDAAPLPVRGRTVVLVDDGVATGATARVAARVLRGRGADTVVLAVPVGPHDLRTRFGRDVDDVVCIVAPRGFMAVGAHYDDFEQTTDDEVVELLRGAGRGPGSVSQPPPLSA